VAVLSRKQTSGTVIDIYHPHGSLRTSKRIDGKENKGNVRVSSKPERRHETIFYAKNQEDVPRKLRNVLEPLLFDESIELLRSLASLKQRLCLPNECKMIAIIFAADKEDLTDILSMKYFFCNVQIVLILPSRKKEIVALGHGLRPRFITYKDADFHELLSVIRKMTGESGRRKVENGNKSHLGAYGK
jgi:hypothetical protein